MKKQLRTLAQIGAAYLIASVILDFILGAYPTLLWLAIGFAFAFFGAIIFGVLWESKAKEIPRRTTHAVSRKDDSVGLKRLCESALERGDASSQTLLSERIMSLAFATAAYHLNEPEGILRAMAEQEPRRLKTKIGDERIFSLITNGPAIRKGDSGALRDSLAKLEEWAE